MRTVGHYPTDGSDAQWEVCPRLLPTLQWRPGGRPWTFAASSRVCSPSTKRVPVAHDARA
jgi:hypothetical protein